MDSASRASTRSPAAAQKVAAQDGVERLVGDDTRVVDPLTSGARVPALEEFCKGMPVRGAGCGARQHPPARLEVFELDLLPERKLNLLACEHVEKRDIVSHAHGAPQLRFDRVFVVIQV